MYSITARRTTSGELLKYRILANQLRESILQGEIPEGDVLPTERELVVQSGLSRGSVREALRMLAVEGSIQTRHGRNGGSVVTLPGNESIANSIDQFVRGRKLPLRMLQEAREALEPLLARLAAQRRTVDDLERLRSLHDELIGVVENFQEFLRVNTERHNAVAAASGNALLAAFLYSICYGVAVSTTTEEYDTMDTRQAVIHIHAMVNEAIASRDPEDAERRMRQHILATHARTRAPDTTDLPLSNGSAE